jgi:hypothetical protein
MMKCLKRPIGLLALLSLTAPLAVNAQSITYTVDRTVSAGSIKGTITTDGTTGVLTAANITGWDLDIFDGVDSANTSVGEAGASIFLRGPQLRATDKELSWAPSPTANDLLQISTIQGPFPHTKFVRWEFANNCCTVAYERLYHSPGNHFQQFNHRNTGRFQIAKVVVDVEIDIKPGSDPNSINPDAGGFVAVAILTTSIAAGDAADFYALDVDPSTVMFGPAGAVIARDAKVKDVDGDGDDDLILHFKISDTGIACGDTEATLTGETFSGDSIEGTDSLITRCK